VVDRFECQHLRAEGAIISVSDTYTQTNKDIDSHGSQVKVTDQIIGGFAEFLEDYFEIANRVQGAVVTD
jgi:hypothetical protein